MARAENDATNLVRLACSKIGDVTFRNNVGLGWVGRMIRQISAKGKYTLDLDAGDVILKAPHKVKYGLMDGSADLIGWRTITITPDMVGKKVAVFLSPEIKSEDGQLEPAQRTWMNNVRAAGGIAFVARKPEDIPVSWEFPQA